MGTSSIDFFIMIFAGFAAVGVLVVALILLQFYARFAVLIEVLSNENKLKSLLMSLQNVRESEEPKTTE